MFFDKSADLLMDEDFMLLAARKGDLMNVRGLIRRGMNVNAVDDTGRTPLIHAAEKGHLDIVKELCEAGADLWALTRNGMSADILAEDSRVRRILRAEMARRSKES